jgi:hypothetical protein
VKLKGDPSGTFLGASPYDLTDSLLSIQMSPILPSSQIDNSDGSQVSDFVIFDNASGSGGYVMISVSADTFYMKFSNTKGVTQSKNIGTYNPDKHAFWMHSYSKGKFHFWTSADGANWKLEWSISNSDWVPDNVEVSFGCYYSDDTKHATVTNVNSNVVVPSSAGNIYLNMPSMAVWRSVFDDAQTRGTIPFISTKLNADHDSFKNPWTDSSSQQVTLGTDLFSLLQGFAGVVDADFIMQPGFQLEVGLTVSLAGNVSLGDDLSELVIIREGVQQLTKQRTRARDTVANLVGAVNQDGTVVSYSDATSISTFGQREGWVQAAAQEDPTSMAIVVQASVLQTKDETLSVTCTIAPNVTGATAFRDFDVADWIGLERPGVPGSNSVIDVIRVIGIAMEVDSSGAENVELTLNTYRQWLAEQLLFLVNKFGGSFLNTIGSTPIQAGDTSPNIPHQGSNLGGLGDVVIE